MRTGFSSNPFRQDETDMIYGTGDRGAYNNQGRFLFMDGPMIKLKLEESGLNREKLNLL
jgi:hypothetical protein